MRAPLSAILDGSESPERRVDLAGSDFVEDPFDQLRLDREGLIDELGETLDGPHYRGARGRTIESVESERIGEETRDPAREAIELGQRILSKRHEHIDTSRSGQQRRKRLRERSGPRVVGVVEKILLGLVQHEVDIAVRLRAIENVDRRAIGDPASGLGDGLGQRCGRVIAPT